MRFYRNVQIEQLAERRLAEFEQRLRRPLTPPIDVELFGELVFDLSILWEEIEELPGEQVLGALRPAEKQLVVNEKRRSLFDSKPGLLRFTEGHEMGHWDLFVDESKLDHPDLFPPVADQVFAFRSSAGGRVQVLNALLSTEEGRDVLRSISARADAADESRAVNRYAAAILMPRQLLEEQARSIDRTRWPNLYRLAERFDVTISALRVRLEQLNLLYVDPAGNLHDSRAEAMGQGGLF